MGLKKYDEKSCGVVLFREENGKREFLLLHYPGGHWDFPKGHVESRDKSEEETALRELHEETGIATAQILSGYREPISYKYYKFGKLSHKLVVFFLAKTAEKSIEISHEHKNFIWLSYEESLKKITFENARNLLKKAEKFLASVSN